MTSNSNYKGRRVHRQGMGYGVIKDIRRGGREYLIDFEDLPIRMWLSSIDVVFIDINDLDLSENSFETGNGLEEILLDFDRTNRIISEEFQVDPRIRSSRKIIEAFRLGVVPYDEIENFTFSRSIETNRIFEALADVEKTGGIVRVIQGEYGTGKSHFMEYIKQLALKKGWVVASTEFDQVEVTPQKPKVVYNKLLISLYAKKGGHKGIVKLITEAISNQEIYKMIKDINHPYLNRLFEIIRNSKTYNRDILWQWFIGHEITIPEVREYCEDKRLPSLLPYYTYAPIVCNILGALSIIFKKMGYKGLLLLFDEAESLANIPSGYLYKAENFLLGLKLAALGKNRSGLQNDKLAHPGVGIDLNYVFNEHSYLAILFAMTPRPEEYSTVIDELVNEGELILLSKLIKEDFIELTKGLVDIYCTAYSLEDLIEEKDVEAIINYIFAKRDSKYQTIRLMIKSIIEVLDILNYNPAENALSLLNAEDDFLNLIKM